MSSVETNPLNEFSGCHSGIIKHLQLLADLPKHLDDVSKTQQEAQKIIDFFHQVVLEHHKEEEEELFEAVRAPLKAEPQQARLIQEQAQKLTQEHRHLEQLWSQLEPALKKLAKGKTTALDQGLIEQLTQSYFKHAEFEENEFLPLAAQVLDGNGLSALGLSLHMRHQDTQYHAYI